MKDDVLGRLRAATRDDHAKLDTELDIFTTLASPAGRLALTSRFLKLHAGAEQVLSIWLNDSAGLDFAGRRRTPLILQDLADLGQQEADEVEPMSALTSQAEALGHLYVLEGSTLGGQMIGRRLARMGQAGLRLLDPYGKSTGARWTSFLEVLQRDCPPDRPDLMDAAVKGGRDGFRRARDLLTGKVASPLEVAA